MAASGPASSISQAGRSRFLRDLLIHLATGRIQALWARLNVRFALKAAEVAADSPAELLRRIRGLKRLTGRTQCCVLRQRKRSMECNRVFA